MTSMQPQARYAALAGFVDACRAAGVDPFATMRAHALDPELLTSPDAWADAAALVAALESGARASGCPTLGLRMSRVRSISSLGPVSLALQTEPTLGGALDLLARFWPSYNQSLRLSLRDEGEWTAAVIRFRLPSDVDHRQATELAAGVLRSLAVGRAVWRDAPPHLGLRLCHAAPADTTEHEELFTAGLEFSAAEDAVVFRTADLEAVAPDDDPQRRAYARRFLDSVASAADDAQSEQVRRLVAVLLPTGRCSASRVAASFGVDRRTVNRWLAEEGQSFATLVTQVRRGQVERQLREVGRSLMAVSEGLGFTTPSSFSRWFGEQYGCSPMKWREAQGAHPSQSLSGGA